MRKDRMKTKEYSAGSTVLTVAFVLICLVWIMPIYEVVVNSLKSNNAINLDVFALPNSESFVSFANYIKGMTFGNYPFLKSVGYSLFISVVSTALILLCCSMAAWYIARVQSGFTGNITLPSAALNEKLRASAAKQGIPLIEGTIHSSDVFYREDSGARPTYWEVLRDEKGCLAVEMESFALFHNAAATKKNAACLLTISDSFVSHEETTAEQPQTSFTNMMEIALGSVLE